MSSDKSLKLGDESMTVKKLEGSIEDLKKTKSSGRKNDAKRTACLKERQQARKDAKRINRREERAAKRKESKHKKTTDKKEVSIEEPKTLCGNELKYFNELVKMVQIKTPTIYSIFLKRLWNKEFYSVVNRDENREEFALELRESLGYSKEEFGKARVIEIFIVLAQTFSQDLRGHSSWKGFRNAFWEIVSNIGGAKFTDKYISEVATITNFETEIDDTLGVFLDRTYDGDGGNGGAFPLQKPPKTSKKQQETELWYQLQYYIVEKKSGVVKKG